MVRSHPPGLPAVSERKQRGERAGTGTAGVSGVRASVEKRLPSANLQSEIMQFKQVVVLRPVDRVHSPHRIQLTFLSDRCIDRERKRSPHPPGSVLMRARRYPSTLRAVTSVSAIDYACLLRPFNAGGCRAYRQSRFTTRIRVNPATTNTASIAQNSSILP